jgi:hypothetical protein
MFLLATLLAGPQSDRRGSGSRGSSDWSWLTGSGRQPRQTSPAATSWLWGYPTKATQPGKKHGWLL